MLNFVFRVAAVLSYAGAGLACGTYGAGLGSWEPGGGKGAGYGFL